MAECPLKKNHSKKVELVENIYDDKINRYRSKAKFLELKIFPEGLKPKQLVEFQAIQKKPSNLNDDSNILCVCEKCGTKYMINPNAKDYEYLLEVKNNISSSVIISDTTIKVVLEDQINDVLNSLCNVELSNENLEELRMSPLSLANKIYDTNIDLKMHITNNLPYFYFIKKLFASIDDRQSVFNTISMEVKLCFTKINDLESDQVKIYYGIVEWILDKSGKDKIKFRAAAEKITSFFVQNCEVFNEIS